MSEGFSGSFGSQMDAEEENFHIYGMNFCGVCKNIMTPNKEQGEKLEFFCKSCDKREIDFSKFRNNQCIIYNKELRPGSRRAIATPELVFDPTMPKIEAECTQCWHVGAFFLITPDDGENCLEVSLICENFIINRCDNVWKMEASKFIYKNYELEDEEAYVQFKQNDV